MPAGEKKKPDILAVLQQTSFMHAPVSTGNNKNKPQCAQQRRTVYIHVYCMNTPALLQLIYKDPALEPTAIGTSNLCRASQY